MAMNYPLDCDTPRKKTEWLYRAQELLRLWYNIFGMWYREGLSLFEYDKMPLKIKNKYPYKPQLSQEDWRRFLKEDFDPRQQKISDQICLQRFALKQSLAWNIKIENII